MADLFLTWDEAREEELPHYCVSCAAPATEWADWRIRQSQFVVLAADLRYVEVTLPVCPRHRTLPWIPLYRVNAKEIHDDGVMLGHVSPGFVEAVWDFRDERDAGPSQTESPSFGSRRAPRRADARNQRARSLPVRSYEDRHKAPTPWSLARIAVSVVALILLSPFIVLLGCGMLALLLGLAFR